MGKVSANFLSLEAFEPDFNKRLCTGTAQNVAFVKLNGAQDINKTDFWLILHLNGDSNPVHAPTVHRYRWQASSHSGEHCPDIPKTVGASLRDEFASVPEKTRQKNGARRLRFSCHRPESGQFLVPYPVRLGSGFAQAFLRSASYSV
jgi:hypothetical protein